MRQVSSWAFGWEALVALGTIGLAGVTALLAGLTRRVAKTSAADVRAQWRPVLVPGDEGRLTQTSLPDNPQQTTITIPVRNAGRGPALYVRALLDPGNEGPGAPSASIAADDELELTFERIYNYQNVSICQLLLDYRDLSGSPYSSVFVITLKNPGPPPRFYDVKAYEGWSVTHLGDSVQQPGLMAVGPASPPVLRRRLRQRWLAARDAFRKPPKPSV